MTDAAQLFPPRVAPLDDATEAEPPAPKASWPLMGDILSARGGVPDHIIEWRRAMGIGDPPPQIKAKRRD